jgi:hypothetical protein
MRLATSVSAKISGVNRQWPLDEAKHLQKDDADDRHTGEPKYNVAHFRDSEGLFQSG